VVAGEAGGITQAVSAYEAGGVTFIDTPGHAAFTGMRERGAGIADIAILIVSAEDGVKPQTVEALNSIRQSKSSTDGRGIPYIVALNKMDRPGANPDRAKQQLAEQEVLVEGYGGTIPVAEISAKTGEGVPELLELINLVAEMEEFKTDKTAPATGFVLETDLNPRTGISATLIIKDGELALGDFVLAGGALAKVKCLNNFLGQPVAELVASAPAQVIGWSELPPVGATFTSYRDKKDAEQAQAEAKLKKQSGTKAPSAAEARQVEIPVLIKAAVAGSLDAVNKEISALATEAVGLKIVDQSVGQITENDVKLAAGSRDSIILGFDVKTDKQATELAEKLGIKIVSANIIYQLSEWLGEEIARRTPVVEVEEPVGKLKLLKIFGQDKGRQIIGGVVTEGRAEDGKPFKILRRDTEIGRGKIAELQQQKIKVKEVPRDSQCGAMVEAKVTLAAGDVLELFDLVTK
jgi:translation initiation factor IF-2